MPQSEGLRRHELSWDGLLRLTPLLRRPSCRGRLLERPRPSHHLTCCRHRHQPRSRLLPFCPWGHPSPPMLRWLRRRYPRPAPLVEEVLDAPTARGVDALEEGGAEPRPVLGSGDLILARRGPNERRGERLRFWTRGASKPLFVLDDE
jgi:hypothetical protein